jgi:hypothetical protein
MREAVRLLRLLAINGEGFTHLEFQWTNSRLFEVKFPPGNVIQHVPKHWNKTQKN